MLSKHYDKVILAASFAVLAFFAIFFYQRVQTISEERQTGFPPVRVDRDYSMTSIEAFEPGVERWRPSPATGDWVFDLFTPPQVYFDPETGFVVEPRGVQDDFPEDDPETIEVEFVELRDVPYRIKLTGYVGQAGDYRIAFRDRESGRVHLVREDAVIEEAEFQVVEFQRNTTGNGNNGEEERARAVIFDQRTGEEITLMQGEDKHVGDVVLVFRTVEIPPRFLSLGPEESFDVGPYTYRIENYTEDPPEVVLLKESPETMEPQRGTLGPGDRL